MFHFCCKFCLQTAYKLRANTIDELRKEIELEERYLETVCELCDAKFREPYFRKEHMKYAHAGDGFECQFCDSSYASKVSLKYHEQTKHVKAAPVECQLLGNLCNRRNFKESYKGCSWHKFCLFL